MIIDPSFFDQHDPSILQASFIAILSIPSWVEIDAYIRDTKIENIDEKKFKRSFSLWYTNILTGLMITCCMIVLTILDGIISREQMYQMTKRKSERYAGPVGVACIYIVINMGYTLLK